MESGCIVPIGRYVYIAREFAGSPLGLAGVDHLLAFEIQRRWG